MSTDTSDCPVSLWNSVARITEKLVNDGASYDTIVTILSLFCLISALQRNTQPAAVAAAPPVATGGLGKLLGDLSKGDGGPSPETLMSLLPLLNSPQMKSKLNPSTIATVLGLLNTMGGGGEKSESPKQEKAEPKGESQALSVEPETEAAPRIIPLEPAEKKTPSRYLNWKTSF